MKLFFTAFIRFTSFVLIAVASVTPTSAHDPITTKVTWSKEIVRIVDRRCAGCHAPGGVAPMPLASYEQARPWARAIKDEVTARRMPKWPAARGFGDFANDRSLSPFEIALIAAWVDGGAPKGEDRDLPKPAAPAPRPAPGVSLKLPPREASPAGERRTFSIPTNLTRDRWMTGWQFVPNDGAIVQVEFTVAGGAYLGNWVPPEAVVSLPSGAGARLRSGAAIAVTVWYRSARAQQDFPIGLPSRAPELALMLGAAPPDREVREIDAGCGETAAPEAGDVFAVRPASARAGAPVGVAIRPPNGPPRVLAWLREFDPGYQATYRLRQAVVLQPGARIDVQGGDASCRVHVQYATRRQ